MGGRAGFVKIVLLGALAAGELAAGVVAATNRPAQAPIAAPAPAETPSSTASSSTTSTSSTVPFPDLPVTTTTTAEVPAPRPTAAAPVAAPAAPRRAAATVAAGGNAGSFAFLGLAENGLPLRFDPCTPVRYVVNPTGAPSGAVDEVHEAFRQLGEATGITFADAGPTDEEHLPVGGAAKRRSSQPDRYGAGWAPILVSWTTAALEPLLAGDTVGYGGSTSFWSGASDPAYITGEIVLDVDSRPLRTGFGPGLTRGTLLLHELGHVVGLDHFEDRSQLMHPSITAATPGSYAEGDRAGLAQLGRGAGCLTVAAPR